MVKIVTINVLLLSILILITGCEKLKLDHFPDSDIIYLTGTFDEPKIGFVNSDGSQNMVFYSSSMYSKPFWTKDSKKIFMLQSSGYGIGGGRLSIWEEGNKIRTCWNWRFIESIGGFMPNEFNILAVVIIDARRIALIDVDRCNEIKQYYDVSDFPSIRLEGASLSNDGNYLLYTRQILPESIDLRFYEPKYSIEVIDLTNGEKIKLTQGANPIWSPDNALISYISVDGIYVMAADGTNQRLIVEFDFSDVTPSQISITAPIPRWSPDGKWLIYERSVPPYKGLIDEKIFKLNIDTGEEIQIMSVDYGYHPYWRAK